MSPYAIAPAKAGASIVSARGNEAPAFAGAIACETRGYSNRLLFALALLLRARAAQAQEVCVTDEGVTYALDPIDGGAMLVNADDPADEVTLMQDCGARYPVLGNGSSAWDGAGVVVMFGQAALRLDGPMPLPAAGC